MKNLLIAVWLVLLFTGVLLLSELLNGNKFLLWLHISLGFLGLALFIVYLIDHLIKHWRWLLFLNRQSISGSLQFLVAIACWLSGIVLFLYGTDPWVWGTVHTVTTFIWLMIGCFHIFKK